MDIKLGILGSETTFSYVNVNYNTIKPKSEHALISGRIKFQEAYDSHRVYSFEFVYLTYAEKTTLEKIFLLCKFTDSEIEFSSINILRYGDSTKEAILEGILSNFGEADENDISYFYFMGHGGVKDYQPIFCPTDYTGSIESAITLKELETTFDMIKGTKILFFESCHSGNFIEKGNEDYFKIFNSKIIDVFRGKKAFNKDTYQVITSSKGSQYTWYCGNRSYFMMGLKYGCQNLSADTDKDYIIDLTELHIFVVDWVENHTDKPQDTQIYPEGSTFPIIEY